MKKIALSAAMVMGACGSVYAQDPGVYVGVKAGSFQIDIDEFDTNDPNAKGFVVGYNLGEGPAIEFEHNKSDTFHVTENGYFLADGDVTTNALYFAYRSQGSVFFKVKGGILIEDVSASGYSRSAEDSDTGLSVGAGFGFNMGEVAQLEAEYTVIEADIGYLSLGLNLRF